MSNGAVRERYAAEHKQLRAGDSLRVLRPRSGFESRRLPKQTNIGPKERRAKMFYMAIYVINMLRILAAEGEDPGEE